MACPWLGPQDPGDPGRGRWPAGGDVRRRHAPSATPTPTVRLPRRAVTGGVRARPRLHPVCGAHTVPNRPLEFTQACRKDTFLHAEIDRLTGPGGLTPGEITLLSPQPFASSLAARLPSTLAAGIAVLDEYALRTFPPPRISFAGIAAFKGLENEAVIVIDLPRPTAPTPWHYVALSRARTCLSVIYGD